uniref:Uncharacterized protein n=1 Tax=Arundo donax TaxID=35708 RepID=A0A0A8Y7V0_ARUDO
MSIIRLLQVRQVKYKVTVGNIYQFWHVVLFMDMLLNCHHTMPMSLDANIFTPLFWIIGHLPLDV